MLDAIFSARSPSAQRLGLSMLEAFPGWNSNPLTGLPEDVRYLYYQQGRMPTQDEYLAFKGRESQAVQRPGTIAMTRDENGVKRTVHVPNTEANMEKMKAAGWEPGTAVVSPQESVRHMRAMEDRRNTGGSTSSLSGGGRSVRRKVIYGPNGETSLMQIPAEGGNVNPPEGWSFAPRRIGGDLSDAEAMTRIENAVKYTDDPELERARMMRDYYSYTGDGSSRPDSLTRVMGDYAVRVRRRMAGSAAGDSGDTSQGPRQGGAPFRPPVRASVPSQAGGQAAPGGGQAAAAGRDFASPGDVLAAFQSGKIDRATAGAILKMKFKMR